MTHKKLCKKYAIYSRKSKFTGVGESTTNQIDICKNRLYKDFGYIKDEDIEIYEDEGFSGYNINRPAFQKLLKDIEENKIKVLIFYKLDRISRNVNDFTKLVSIFDKYEVKFLSSTENIETITPTGKAMMYMISVFSELERDTIAERIKDNMIELAKTGRWLGGNPPTGYSSIKVDYINYNGKKKKLYNLKENNEIDKIKLLYQKILELKSLTKLETFTLNNNIKTINNKNYTRWTLNNILRNPVYVKADKDIYNYYSNLNANIYNTLEDFTGLNGLMVYNKTENKKTKIIKNDIKKWIIAIGHHKGIIDGLSWINVQEILDNNKDMCYRKCASSPSLFSGIIKCSKCLHNMRPKKRKDTFDYICSLKEKSKKKLCDQNNINGTSLDEAILRYLLAFKVDSNKIIGCLEKSSKKYLKTSNSNELKRKYEKNNNSIKDLIDKIKYVDKSIIKDINIEILKLKEENKQILTELNKEKKELNYNALARNIVNSYISSFKDLDSATKRFLMKSIIETIIVDANTIIIKAK